MDNKIVYSKYVQGALHKPENKPCQDYALHVDTDEYAIIVLSDGHGGDKYFRSDKGAKLACEIALDALKEFCKEADFGRLPGESEMLQVSVADSVDENDARKKEAEYVMRHMFRHICSEWHARIAEHMKTHPLTEEEERYLRAKGKDGKSLYSYYFDSNGELIHDSVASAYGCTLFGVAVTREGYWVGFHIGDGKCVAIEADGTWSEPIPWDERCFQNFTTSLSSYADESFRYCIGKSAPCAVFIASDGMDDSYSPMEELAYVYVMKYMANLAIYDKEKTEEAIEGWLDRTSEKGSKDDMSLCFIIDSDRLDSAVKNYVTNEIRSLEDALVALKADSKEKSDELQRTEECIDRLQKEIQSDRDKMEQIANNGCEKEEKLDKIKEEIESIKKAHKFLDRLKNKTKEIFNKKCRIKDGLSDKEKEAKDLDEDIKGIANSLDEIAESITTKEAELEKSKYKMPLLKKHCREAESRYTAAQNKLAKLHEVSDRIKNK